MSEILLILDTVAFEHKLKILGVVDLLLSTVNGSVKREVFKYELVLENELDENKPMVTFALCMNTLGSCKIPSENNEN